VTGGDQTELAATFVTYVTGEQGLATLVQFGFGPPPPPG